MPEHIAAVSEKRLLTARKVDAALLCVERGKVDACQRRHLCWPYSDDMEKAIRDATLATRAAGKAERKRQSHRPLVVSRLARGGNR